MLTLTVYPIVWMVLWGAFLLFMAALLLRMILDLSDPNPFGALGRLGYKVRKYTERYVYPAARFFATFGINTRWAPLLTIFIAFLLVYFASGIIFNTLNIIDNLAIAIAEGRPVRFIGVVLYAILSVLVLFIFIRFISSWFVFHRNTFLGFVRRVTDPILLPFQRLIPPVGMFDLSAMIVLLLIYFLQGLVLSIFR